MGSARGLQAAAGIPGVFSPTENFAKNSHRGAGRVAVRDPWALTSDFFSFITFILPMFLLAP